MNFFNKTKGRSVVASEPSTNNLDSESSTDNEIEVRRQKVETRPVNSNELTREEIEVIEKYHLKYDVIEKHYDFLIYGNRRVFYITARGVEFLCRKLCKRVSIVGEPTKGIIFQNGKAYCIAIVVEAEDFSGRSVQKIGCTYVTEKGIPVAIKAAETNAAMRALRSLVGINTPDEVMALELESKEEK